MASWLAKWKNGRVRGGGEAKKVVLDGTEIRELVENKQAYSNFVDHKFQELDTNHNGKLSVKELQPAVADIGAALGLPARGTSPDSDFIYDEVLNEFTHGKQKEVSKSEFQKVLSDILLGMAAGLKRDPIVILRMNGEDFREFIQSPRFEPEMVAIFTQMDSANVPLRECIRCALQQLTVEHGMPPATDAWVMENILEPALQSVSINDNENRTSQDTLMEWFKMVADNIIQRLQEQPVIVAHTENTFDGSGIRRLLSNKFELDKLLEEAWRGLPKDSHQKFPKEYLRVVLDRMAASANLPPIGAVDQVDAVVNEAFKMVEADDGKPLEKEDFKNTLIKILGSIMLQLEGNPISVTTNSVVHEPMDSSSTLLPPSPTAMSENE